MIRHLSWPRDWNSNSGDFVSSNPKKNLSESLPVGPPSSIACPATQRSHSSRISALASCCFMVARSQTRKCRAGWSYRAGRACGEKMSAPPRLKDIFVVNEGGSNLLNLSELFKVSGRSYGQRIPFCGRNFDADSDDFPRA